MQNTSVTALIADLLEREASVTVRVSGRSMQPHLRDGDTVTIARVPPGSLRRGDLVLAAAAAGVLRLHRVVALPRGAGRLAPLVVTKGDALLAPDEPFPGERIIGRVVRLARTSCGSRTPHRALDLPVERLRAAVFSALSLRLPRVFRTCSLGFDALTAAWAKGWSEAEVAPGEAKRARRRSAAPLTP